jgi:NADH:ubiquinone reductase (non-electrogenic)
VVGLVALYTALRLSQLPWEETTPIITLVDHRDRFLFSPLLYEVVTEELETWEIAPPYEELLAGTQIQFRQAAVQHLDLDQRQVTLSRGAPLTMTVWCWPWGAIRPWIWPPVWPTMPCPSAPCRMPITSKKNCALLEASDADKIRVAVVGGGYSGVELACKLAERLGNRGRLRLIERTDQILRTSPEYNRTVAQQALSDLGVWVDLETSVAGVAADSISLAYQGQTDILPVDLVLWTVGTRVNPVVASLPIQQTERHQIVVQPTLESVDKSGVYALGDLADCRDADGQQVPNNAQAALQQADFVGWNIWASLTERPQLPFRYRHLGEMLTLGTERATLTGLGIQLDGPLAHVARPHGLSLPLAYLQPSGPCRH